MNFVLFWLLVKDGLFSMIPGAFYHLVWPALWRFIFWSAAAILGGATLARIIAEAL